MGGRIGPPLRKMSDMVVSYFGAVSPLRFSPDYLTRERQEFKEEGKPQVSLPLCPCRGRGSLPRSAERNSPLRFSENLPARKGRTRLRSSRTPVSQCRNNPPQCHRYVPPLFMFRKTAAKTRKTRHQAALLHRPVAFLSNK